jgi:hypothetical protein
MIVGRNVASNKLELRAQPNADWKSSININIDIIHPLLVSNRKINKHINFCIRQTPYPAMVYQMPCPFQLSSAANQDLKN